MKNLEFEAVCGKERKKVKLAQMSSAENYFHIYVGDYYLGQLFKRAGNWIAYLNDAGVDVLTGDDILILGSMIEESDLF